MTMNMRHNGIAACMNASVKFGIFQYRYLQKVFFFFACFQQKHLAQVNLAVTLFSWQF